VRENILGSDNVERREKSDNISGVKWDKDNNVKVITC
jgi:hypothetical protein